MSRLATLEVRSSTKGLCERVTLQTTATDLRVFRLLPDDSTKERHLIARDEQSRRLRRWNRFQQVFRFRTSDRHAECAGIAAISVS